jgi:phage tail sheath protein FI
MPTYGRAGVYVTQTLSGPTPPPTTTSPSVAAFAGEHWRGPSYAVLCKSWNDFVKFFGGFNPTSVPAVANPYLPYAVFEFFSNGGQNCWVLRIASSVTPGSSASITLKDSQATPVNTLTLTAGILGVIGNVGTWGNNLYVDVVANNSVPGTGRFNLNIYYGGSTQQYKVETWTDLSMSPTDTRYVVSVLNSPTQGSNWVVATNLNDPASSPANTPLPGLGRQFSGGVDAADPSTSDYQAAFTYGNVPPATPAPFDQVPGILNINIPGMSTAAVITTAITYAASRPYTFLVIDTPSGQTPAGAASYFSSLGSPSSYAAVYYPWLNATNPAGNSLQTTILLPPGGFVLGQMVATDQSSGVWTAPAGLSTVLNNVVAAERLFAPSELDALNTGNIDVLRTRPNGNVVIWGARTMQSGYASLYVPVQRTLNYIESSLAALLEYVVFQPNDALLWSTITATCNNFLSGLFFQNAFPGSTAAQSYYVLCNASNNTAQTISQGIVNTTVGVALQYPAEFINLTIAQFQSSGATTISSVS